MFRRWHQNLNEDKKSWIHFRGSLTKERPKGRDFRLIGYEFLASKELQCRFRVTLCRWPQIKFSFGFLFFSLYLTLPFFGFKRLGYEGERETGFYVHNWALVWSFWQDPMGGWSTRDPFWKHFYFSIDDFFLGRNEIIEDRVSEAENVYFKLGDREFCMNRIKWIKRRVIRRFIPYSLYHHTYYSVDMKIDKPPMHAGKGENSWDCGDDGSYGLFMGWKHGIPSWNETKKNSELAVRDYVDHCFRKPTKRYGRADDGLAHDIPFEFIGIKRENGGQECGLSSN